MDINILIAILQNPLILGAIFALVRNMGGYIYNCFEAKKLLPYSGSDLLTTLGLWETFFLLLAGLAGLSIQTTIILVVIIDIVRSFRKAVSEEKSTKPTS